MDQEKSCYIMSNKKVQHASKCCQNKKYHKKLKIFFFEKQRYLVNLVFIEKVIKVLNPKKLAPQNDMPNKILNLNHDCFLLYQ